MLAFFGTALFLLICLDAAVTIRRCLLFGAGIEVNPLVRWLVKRLGPFAGVLLGILVPGLGLVGLLTWLGWIEIMACLVGLRLLFAVKQLASFRFEQELLKARVAGRSF